MWTDTHLKDWKGAKTPDHRVLEGRFVRLEPLNVAQHGDQLWNEFTGLGSDPNMFDYMLSGLLIQFIQRIFSHKQRMYNNKHA